MAGIEVVNDNNIIINQDFSNLRLIKKIHFRISGLGASGIECSDGYEMLRFAQSSMEFYGLAYSIKIKVPNNCMLCAAQPIGDCTEFSYELFHGSSDKDGYIVIYFNSAGRVNANVNFYLFGIPKNNQLNKLHKCGLQVLKKDGTVAFDALYDDYMVIKDFKLLTIPSKDFRDYTYTYDTNTRNTYVSVNDSSLALCFYSTAGITNNPNHPDARVVRPCLTRKGDTTSLGLMWYLVQGRAEETIPYQNDCIIPLMLIDVSRLYD